jgi:hypothetical protein
MEKKSQSLHTPPDTVDGESSSTSKFLWSPLWPVVNRRSKACEAETGMWGFHWGGGDRNKP